MLKAGERELANFDGNRRAVGMLNPMRDKHDGVHGGGNGMVYVTTACLNVGGEGNPPTGYAGK